MKITMRELRQIIAEIVQIPTPKFGERAIHKVEEEITEEMLGDIISVLPLWEAGEYEQVETLIQDLHTIGRNQLHNLMHAAEEMANYGQINDDAPEWVTDYFHDKFSEGWETQSFGE